MKRFFAAAMLSLVAAPAFAGENVTYDVNGASFEGYMAKASGNSKGLVLVIHDWDGLDNYETTRADMLAKMGYDAFAVDLYGKGNRPKDTDAKKSETKKLYDDREKMRSLILGGLAQARKMGGGDAVIMGYCFGGAAVLELARSGKGENIKGYATFHGGLSTPAGQSYPASTAPILIAHGGADSSIKMSDVASISEQLEAAKVPYEIQVYSGAPHAFTVFGSNRYQKTADEQSWDAFSDFLGANLGG